MREMSQSTSVSLAHRYWNEAWSEQDNRATYGRLASPKGVGNNVRVDVCVGDERDLEPAVARVRGLLDHRALFNEVPEFSDVASTLERLTAWVGRTLAREFVSFRRVTLFESERFSCAFDASDDAFVRVTQREFNLDLVCRSAIDARTGLAVSREVIGRAVRRVAPRFADPHPGAAGAWAAALCRALTAEVPALTELRVDLDGQCALRVTADV